MAKPRRYSQTTRKILAALIIGTGLATGAWTCLQSDPRQPLYVMSPDSRLRLQREAPLTPQQQDILENKLARADYFGAIAVSPTTGALGGVRNVNSLAEAHDVALRICARRADDCVLHADLVPADWKPWHAYLPGTFLTSRQADGLRVIVPGSITLVIGVNGKGGYHLRMFRRGETPDLENEMRVCKLLVKEDVEAGFPCRLIVGRHVKL